MDQEQNQVCQVKYQVATYSGTETVYCNENDENDHIIGKAKGQLKRRAGELPFGYESWKITSRDYI